MPVDPDASPQNPANHDGSRQDPPEFELGFGVGAGRGDACTEWAHPSSPWRSGRLFDDLAPTSNFGRKMTSLPLSIAQCSATNSPCTWKIGSVCSRTSSALNAQDVVQSQRVRLEVRMREHGALRAPRRAGRVKHRSEVVGVALRNARQMARRASVSCAERAVTLGARDAT